MKKHLIIILNDERNDIICLMTKDNEHLEIHLKQKKFCHEYLIDFNATKAAIRAGYSETSAYSQGHDLLKKPEIKKFIEQLSKTEFEAIGLSRNRLILELATIGFNQEGTPASRVKALTVLMDQYPVDPKSNNQTDLFRENSSRVLDALKKRRIEEMGI